MASQRRVAIITCNGIDGACAAAIALRRFPGAGLIISSASSIGYTLKMLSCGRGVPGTVHVCGIGVGCAWEELAEACQALGKCGAAVFWHCGRGYLDAVRDRLAGVCAPVFVKAASNTEAVCRHLGMEGDARAQFLLQLALHDHALSLANAHLTTSEEFWRDFLAGSALQYFKFMDRNAYSDAIRKLACGEEDDKARQIAEVFRKTGAKRLLAGRSRVLAQLKERIRRCADADEHALITGESGVGKEWVAHLIHERSRRATEAFVPINCASFTGSIDLANSDLFGHRKGAFTGATEDRKGKLVEANGGILFLDELGDLPAEVQAKLLRVVEDGEVIPVGADRPAARVDVRVVAATNRDLPGMIREGRFREDLFHRLSVLRIRVPALREHFEDLGEIAAKTLAEMPGEAAGRRLAAEDLNALRSYDWPGNVRQLMQVLKRWVYLDLPLEQLIEEERQLGFAAPAGEPGRNALLPLTRDGIRPLAVVRREYAQRCLELHGGNLTATAKALGVAINTLKKLLHE